MINVTFLSGYKPLVKEYHPNKVVGYPLVKRVTSHTYTITRDFSGLREKHRLLREHARKGHCLLKGPLKKELVNESRAGHTDNSARTETLIFDIDGVAFPNLRLQPPFSANHIQTIAEKVIAELPDAFHDVSYIAHASGSLGMKGDLVSLHIEFWLTHSISPQLLKCYLTALNLDIPFFCNALELSATGTALRYKIDRTLAENSRLIFIGTPIFGEGVDDPIPTPDDRIILVEKNHLTADLGHPNERTDIVKVQRLVNSRISGLRRNAGLPRRGERMIQVRHRQNNVGVVSNPDGAKLSYAYDNGHFVYYNLNNGDSNAYYVYKDKPQIVFNFKGEPPFLFERADPDTYQWHLSQFGLSADASDEGTSRSVPLVFRDRISSAYFAALFDPVEKRLLEIWQTDRIGLEDWMAQYDGIMPDNIPVWRYSFEPTDSRTVDIADGFVNRYHVSEWVQTPVGLPTAYTQLTYGQAHHLKHLCPTVFKVIWSMLGCGDLELEHFINWLACVVNEKQKTGTAWLMHGVQGTGKGVFFEHIIKPILTHHHAYQVRTDNLDDPFNAWLEQGILVILDEFNNRNARSQNALLAKLKNYITEPQVSIRGMRENLRSVQSYTNFILYSNDHDALRLDDTDRRYNVCPRQETPLKVQYPEIEQAIQSELPSEVPLFASFLLHFQYDIYKARLVLENTSKTTLRDAAQSTVDEFVQAIKAGDLEYFLPIMEAEPNYAGRDWVLAGRNLLTTWIRNFDPNEQTVVFTADLMALFGALSGEPSSERVFGKLLARRGLTAERVRRNGVQRRGFKIQWRLLENSIDVLRREYLADNVVSFNRTA